MKKQKLVIGLVGENGSGKGTFVKALRKAFPGYRIRHRRFSDLLSKTLRDWSLPKTRRNLQKMAVGMRNEFGPNTLAHAMEEVIRRDLIEEIAKRDYQDKNRTKSPLVILDGVRWMPDVKMLKKLPNSILCYITADQEIRFTRMKKRKEKKGEAFMTWERFLREEKAPNEVLISHIGKRYANVSVLRNNGTKREFLELAERLIAREILPRLKERAA